MHNKARDQQLLQIAPDHLFIETLETQHSDRLDFHDVSVWTVKAALQAAFEAFCTFADQAGSLYSRGIRACRKGRARLIQCSDRQAVPATDTAAACGKRISRRSQFSE